MQKKLMNKKPAKNKTKHAEQIDLKSRQYR